MEFDKMVEKFVEELKKVEFTKESKKELLDCLKKAMIIPVKKKAKKLTLEELKEELLGQLGIEF